MKILEVDINELIPYENNPRKNEAAVEKVAASIKEFGFKIPIVIDKENIIIAGHTRLKAAKLLGLDKVPVIVADDLSEEQIKAFRLADNKTAEFAEWDFSKLDEELAGLENLDMSLFGFEELEESINTTTEREDIKIGDEKYQLVIDCENEIDMNEKYNIVSGVGIECRILTL